MKIRKMECIGIIFTVIMGILLHFTYEWSNQNSIVGLFSPVNESTWEHMKMLFFPYLFYSIFEYKLIGKNYSNYITAKGIGVITGLFIIPFIFYAYQWLMNQNNPLINIIIFLVSVIIAYVISYNMLRKPRINVDIIMFLIFIYLVLVFFQFTKDPPHLFLFIDPTK